MTDFRALLRRLVECGVNFIVVGGAAATAHGSARLTLDLDVVYERAPHNVRQLIVALSEYSPYPRGAPPGLPFLWDEKTILNGLNFTLSTTVGDIDLLGEISGGGGYQQLFEHTDVLRLFGVECRCLGLDWLIRVKRAAGRPKDFEVIAELESIWEERGSQE